MLFEDLGMVTEVPELVALETGGESKEEVAGAVAAFGTGTEVAIGGGGCKTCWPLFTFAWFMLPLPKN